MLEAVGGFAAMTSALSFAFASVFFRRLGDEVSPVGVNLGKGLIACVLTALTLVTVGDLDDVLISWVGGEVADSPSFVWITLQSREWFLLILSGFLGITVGDTAYFAALNALGTRRTLLLDTLAPATTAILAVLILGEVLGLAQVVGIALTLVGIGWVMRERVSDNSRSNRAATRKGLAWGLVAVASHALGVIAAKDALELVPSLPASFIRQGSALVLLAGWAAVSTGLRAPLAPLFKKKNLLMLFGASFCGTFLGIWFAMLGLRLALASVAATLNATTPLFILPLNRYMEKERVSGRAVLGAVVAVVGAGVLIGGG